MADDPIITVYMDRACSRCGEMGSTDSGLCLKCGAEAVIGRVGKMSEQLSLTTQYVELTSEEKIERGFRLASLLREAQLMADEHTERKKEMKEEREALEEKISALAMVVRTGKEERPVGVNR